MSSVHENLSVDELIEVSVDRGEGFIKLVMILMVVFMALKLWYS